MREESTKVLEYISFEPMTVNMIYGRYLGRPVPETIPDDLFEYVCGQFLPLQFPEYD
ncbi:uncharacterized protein BDW47DRAFT_102079 [Aspergillus candidus]|uniref:Uncharacterized protein n=1 Tax=Aspergillus candidus TaxID=41067 RepID=A0A2I2FH97_ASPCN|nr:hypothetical protein BDW47DRAFT_102079 [Aspergillus candidus]PLB40002.1 hypothetical protein BDW47DRAFT_102079 [Aspergillus candidus]